MNAYRYGHGERVGCLADMDKRTVSFYREGADGGAPTRLGSGSGCSTRCCDVVSSDDVCCPGMIRLAGCIVSGVPDGVRIVATPASEGSTVQLSFPVDPVLSRLDDLDASAAARSKV